jgi:hypothetical protein
MIDSFKNNRKSVSGRFGMALCCAAQLYCKGGPGEVKKYLVQRTKRWAQWKNRQ